MEEQPYTDNPTLDRFLTEMVAGIKDIQRTLSEHTDVHNDIAIMVEGCNEKLNYTNGKVGELIKWRERINGGSIVSGIFMSVIVIPILGWCVYSLITLPERINQVVKDALVIYEIPHEKD